MDIFSVYCEGVSRVDSICIAFFNKKVEYKWFYFDGANSSSRLYIFDKLQKFVSQKNNLLVIHDASIQLKMLIDNGLNLSCKIFDTCVAYHYLDSCDENKSLVDVVKSILKRDIRDDHACCIYDLYKEIKDLLEKEDLLEAFNDIEMETVKIFTESGCRGILVDKLELLKIKEKV